MLNFSPRKKGNSAGLVGVMAEGLKEKDAEVFSYSINDMNLLPCKACSVCKTKDTAFCAQEDDFTKMISLLDECDGIVFAAPVYFGQIPGTAKNFIDRLYCFFNPAKTEPLFTPKEPKKMAVLLPCGGGDPASYQHIADWVGGCFRTIGITESKSLIHNGLNGLWDPEEPGRAAFAKEAVELADWLLS